MARELRVVHNASANIYAILRKAADDTVWNGSSFVTWSDANITSYAITLTSRGGDLFTADFPSGVSAGSYSVYYYKRAGVNPATTDDFLGGRELYWNGDAVTSSPGTYLTTLARVKRYAGISGTSYDTKLTELLAAATTHIQRHCNTGIIAEEYTEIRNGTGGRYMQTANIPIINLQRVASSIQCALSVSYSGLASLAFSRVLTDGVLLQSVSGGTVSNTTLTFASYPTLETLATAISAVSGWTASVSGSFAGRASADLIVSPGLDAINGVAELPMALYTISVATYNPSSGVIGGRFPQGWRNIELRYRAGYETIPDDIQTAACAVVKALHDMSRRDTTLQSERIGDYAYANGQSQAAQGLASISREAAMLLEPYRNVSFA
jgi:hypothetical protein